MQLNNYSLLIIFILFVLFYLIPRNKNKSKLTPKQKRLKSDQMWLHFFFGLTGALLTTINVTLGVSVIGGGIILTSVKYFNSGVATLDVFDVHGSGAKYQHIFNITLASLLILGALFYLLR